MTTPPPIILQVNDRVQFLTPDGQVLEGQVARAFPLQRLDGSPAPWTIFVVPAEDAAPAQAQRGWD